MASCKRFAYCLVILMIHFASLSLCIQDTSSTERSITFQQTTDICETTNGVKSYSGYVHLPAGDLQASEQNVFFWFFESREDPKTAPLTIWLQGGPGSGSIDQALGGNGPCRVLNDSKSTQVNEWSWNKNSNVLYIDQPIFSGYSYDEAAPGKLGLISGNIYADGILPPEDEIFINGSFGSQDLSNTPSTSTQAAAIIWDFMQTWMNEPSFQDYQRDSIALWTQSYGGHWGPAIVGEFARNSETILSLQKRCRGVNAGRPISISHLGILSGIIDFLVQGEHYPSFAVNNTYNIQAYSPDDAESAMAAFEAPGGCKELAVACQETATELDPENTGTNIVVTGACLSAFRVCWDRVYSLYDEVSMRNAFDITQGVDIQFPEPYAKGFLNREVVQKKLGVDIQAGKGVNYTSVNPVVSTSYVLSGDYLRKDFRLDLGRLLDLGIPVTLAYGDRDYQANWFGGEALSKAIPFNSSSAFASAGYADFVVDGSVVGKTRQAGLLSFTRIFQAGHEIPFYNPSATYNLFLRALQNKDIPTGQTPASVANPGFSTSGLESIRDVTQSVEGSEGSSFCYIMNPPLSLGQCSDEQLRKLKDGCAVVVDFIVQ